MKINQNLLEEIILYAASNEKDAAKVLNSCVQRGFTIEKFGATPSGLKGETEVVEKEVIKEVIKEVEKEVIKEVIKEVEVEKEVYITDDEAVSKLTIELDEVRRNSRRILDEFNEFKSKTSDIQKRSTQAILKLNKEKDLLVEEYENKIKLMKNPPKKDIYGENKGGASFGSNLLDGIWPKKK